MTTLQKKGVEKYSAKYWQSEITSAEQRLEKFWQQGKESIKVYNTTHDDKDISRRLHVWWYLVQTLLPAYYSSTPKVEADLKKFTGTQIHEIGATILERTTQYCMDDEFDFDYVGYASALQFLLVGRAVLWARYDATVEDVQKDYALLSDGAGGLVSVDGKPFTGDESKIQTIDGQLIYSETLKEKTRDTAILDLVNYRDFLHSDGRTEQEIRWKGRRAFLSEDEVTELFGKKTADKLKYDSFPEAIKRNEIRGPESTYEGKAELFEIYCEEAGKVFWLQKGDKSILESDDPPIKFEGFYPCEVLSASIDPDSTIPTSDYVHCRDQIIEVERLTTRIHAMTQAIRANFGYDATCTELEDMISGDLKMVPIRNWPTRKGSGGLSGSMDALPIQPYVDALNVLQQARATALQQLYETIKASDLLRGVSDPVKTATANRLESQWSSLGLIVRQNMFAEFIGKSIGKLAVIIATQYSSEKILEAGDSRNLIGPLVNDDPMQVMQIENQVIDLLKNDTERCYRLRIASDSMVALDEKQERQDNADLLQSAGSFFQQLQGMIEQYPPMVTLGLQLFKRLALSYRGGKEVEPYFEQAFQQIAQMAEQKAQQPQQDDGKASEVQAKLQIAQMQQMQFQQKMQMEQMQMALDERMKQLEAMVTMQKVQVEREQVAVDAQKAQAQQAVAQIAADTDMQRMQTEIAKELLDTQQEKIKASAHIAGQVLAKPMMPA